MRTAIIGQICQNYNIQHISPQTHNPFSGTFFVVFRVLHLDPNTASSDTHHLLQSYFKRVLTEASTENVNSLYSLHKANPYIKKISTS